MRKDCKELSKVKNEKKLLQTMTTEAMYGMIHEKQDIRSMREEFDRRRD